MAIYRVKIFSEISSSSEIIEESSNINGHGFKVSKKINTSKSSGHPRITKLHKETKLYGSVLGEKQFGVGSWISKKLNKKIEEYIPEANKLQKSLLTGKNIKPIDSFIENETKKSNAFIVEKEPGQVSPSSKKITADDFKTLENLDISNLSEEDKNLLVYLMSLKKKGGTKVFWEPSDGLETLAHELGHSRNHIDNIIDRCIQNSAYFLKLHQKSEGVLAALLDVLSSGIIIWEEKNASRKGYSMLKKYNLSDEELKLAKENLDNAIKLYNIQSKLSWRKKLLGSRILKWLK